MPASWESGHFCLETELFGCSADTEHSEVRSLSRGGGLNSPALTVFSGVMGMITPVFSGLL